MEERLVTRVVALTRPAHAAVTASQESLCWAAHPAGRMGTLPALAGLLRPLGWPEVSVMYGPSLLTHS